MRKSGLLFAIAFGWLMPEGAQAQQAYCAFYNDGTQTCGIPTLQSCEQSVSGVGGMCHPDDSAQIPPNFMQRWRAARQQNNYNTPSPPGLDDVPPPPGMPAAPSAAAPTARYCAIYYDGGSNCGFFSLEECEEAVRGVGGSCRNR
jgi:hypothetical protein